MMLVYVSHSSIRVVFRWCVFFQAEDDIRVAHECLEFRRVLFRSQLIDGIASWWTAVHGYNHPHIAEALKAQIDRMPHVMLGGLVHEPGARLAARGRKSVVQGKGVSVRGDHGGRRIITQ